VGHGGLWDRAVYALVERNREISEFARKVFLCAFARLPSSAFHTVADLLNAGVGNWSSRRNILSHSAVVG